MANKVSAYLGRLDTREKLRIKYFFLSVLCRLFFITKRRRSKSDAQCGLVLHPHEYQDSGFPRYRVTWHSKVVFWPHLSKQGVTEFSHATVKRDSVGVYCSQHCKDGLFFFHFTDPQEFFLLSHFSIEGFKALGFDPHTMQGSQPMGGPLPPQDALVHLHKLSSMVSQLLQAFSRYLSPFISLLAFKQTTKHSVCATMLGGSHWYSVHYLYLRGHFQGFIFYIGSHDHC